MIHVSIKLYELKEYIWRWTKCSGLRRSFQVKYYQHILILILLHILINSNTITIWFVYYTLYLTYLKQHFHPPRPLNSPHQDHSHLSLNNAATIPENIQDSQKQVLTVLNERNCSDSCNRTIWSNKHSPEKNSGSVKCNFLTNKIQIERQILQPNTVYLFVKFLSKLKILTEKTNLESSYSESSKTLYFC